jgi:hypothetical protein
LSGSRFRVHGFNPEPCTIVQAKTTQPVQEKPEFNSPLFRKEPLNREPGTLNLCSYHNFMETINFI